MIMNKSPQARMRDKINEIFAQSEVSLCDTLAAGKVMMHIGIDWQRLYCDPDFEASPHRKLNSPGVQQALLQMRATIDDLRRLMPSIWVVHDIKIQNDFLDPDHEVFNLEGRERQRKMALLRIQSQDMCLPTLQGEPILKKPEYCAFAKTPLHEFLQACKVDAVLLSGVLRSVCVKETALTSVSMGYDTYIAENLTADQTLQHFPSYAKSVIERAEQGIKMVRSENIQKILTGAPL